jgi:hypothetical protein
MTTEVIPTIQDINKLLRVGRRLKYKYDEHYKETVDRNNKLWYSKKNKETSDEYKADLAARMKKKYEENEEYREHTKKKRMERYYRQKAEREAQKKDLLKKEKELEEIKQLIEEGLSFKQ